MNIICAFPGLLIPTIQTKCKVSREEEKIFHQCSNLVSVFGTVKSVLSDGLGLLVEFCEGWICLSQVFAPPRTKSPLDHLEVEAHQFLSILLFLLNKFPSAAVSRSLPDCPGLPRLVSAK